MDEQPPRGNNEKNMTPQKDKPQKLDEGRRGFLKAATALGVAVLAASMPGRVEAADPHPAPVDTTEREVDAEERIREDDAIEAERRFFIESGDKLDPLLYDMVGAQFKERTMLALGQEGAMERTYTSPTTRQEYKLQATDTGEKRIHTLSFNTTGSHSEAFSIPVETIDKSLFTHGLYSPVVGIYSFRRDIPNTDENGKNIQVSFDVITITQHEAPPKAFVISAGGLKGEKMLSDISRRVQSFNEKKTDVSVSHEAASTDAAAKPAANTKIVDREGSEVEVDFQAPNIDWVHPITDQEGTLTQCVGTIIHEGINYNLMKSARVGNKLSLKYVKSIESAS